MFWAVAMEKDFKNINTVRNSVEVMLLGIYLMINSLHLLEVKLFDSSLK